MKVDKKNLPRHIAIIMDGNGRWAKKKGLPRIIGHRAGVESVREIVRICGKIGIKFLTLYAFSTENWARPNKEVKTLMSLLKEFLKIEVDELNKNNVKFTAMGRLNMLPKEVIEILRKTIEKTRNNTGLVLNMALSYGGRQEIIDAVNRVLIDKKKVVSEKSFRKYLYKNIPDPDLLIRTSGEMRISNFLLWQIAYTEIYITKKFWPDFKKDDLLKAVKEFQKRKRRFGGL